MTALKVGVAVTRSGAVMYDERLGTGHVLAC